MEQLEDLYNKEEKYWKRFSEKSSEEEDIHNEKYILIVENLLNEILIEVKEFMEKNDTTGGEFSSESFGSVGNQNFNQEDEEEEEESESVEEISPLPHKTTVAPPPLLQKSSPAPLHNSISPPVLSSSHSSALFQSVSTTSRAKCEEEIEVYDKIGFDVI